MSDDHTLFHAIDNFKRSVDEANASWVSAGVHMQESVRLIGEALAGFENTMKQALHIFQAARAERVDVARTH